VGKQLYHTFSKSHKKNHHTHIYIYIYIYIYRTILFSAKNKPLNLTHTKIKSHNHFRSFNKFKKKWNNCFKIAGNIVIPRTNVSSMLIKWKVKMSHTHYLNRIFLVFCRIRTPRYPWRPSINWLFLSLFVPM
jgi:hypothetical protein